MTTQKLMRLVLEQGSKQARNEQGDRRKFWSCCVLATSLVLCLYAHPTPVTSAPDSAESEFLVANNKAMAKMMNGMKIKESGDVDRDFTNLMIPHHQGAIDMARAELPPGPPSSMLLDRFCNLYRGTQARRDDSSS
jgi:Domain of unknown function (DUF305)